MCLAGFPGGSVIKNLPANAGDAGSIPGSGRSPQRRKWQPTPVLLPGESHGGRSLVGYSPWSHKELDTTERFQFNQFNSILIPGCISSSPAFLMMYSAYKLNKQGDNILPWRTPFPIWNQSVVPCPILTVAYWPAYRFLKRQVRRSGIPISLRIFHSLLWSTQSKALT